MAVNADLEPMTSSDLDLTSQTETEDTDTGDLEESGTTFSSSDGSDSTLSTMSSSNASKMSKENGLSNMNSVSSTDGSTSTGNDEQVDISNSDFAFKYPSLPKASYDLTEVSELSDVDLSSVCNQKSPTKTQHGEENAGLRDQKTFQFPDFQAMKGAWFTHPCFKRYWDHYSSVMTWCKRHSHAHNSISQKNRSQSTCIPPQDFNQISDMLSWQQYYLNSYYFGTSQFPWNGNFNRRDSTRSTAKASKKKRRKKKNAKSRSGGGQGQSKCSEEDADSAETFEMEITDEMMEFFKQSEEHRRTRGMYVFLSNDKIWDWTKLDVHVFADDFSL